MSHRTRERPAECLASLSHSTMIERVFLIYLVQSKRRRNKFSAGAFRLSGRKTGRAGYRLVKTAVVESARGVCGRPAAVVTHYHAMNLNLRGSIKKRDDFYPYSFLTSNVRRSIDGSCCTS
ncbi:hypothetical protein EVAR_56536_1 [Eumeta japonica]|uniref:Uncharacterized protein n=1 Tax=Eumeta variegata TaxID=151549 RepID=A0A4C1YYR4_EUMVA|nr:hypothetical protein EVAR_56536_1 [Eumeta japonica]